MNERIQELLFESNIFAKNSDGEVDTTKVHLNKFAELIVRECAKVAWYHTPDWEQLEYGHLVEDKILKHFGVEE